MRIGILSEKIENLRNDQLRILRDITDQPQMELVLFIHRLQGNKVSVPESWNLPVNNKINRLSKRILLAQLNTEERFFKEWKTVVPEVIKKKIADVNIISVAPEIKGLPEIYLQEECELIHPFNLDMMIELDSKATYSANILSTAKLGIWRLYFGEKLRAGSGPSGFSEIINKIKALSLAEFEEELI